MIEVISFNDWRKYNTDIHNLRWYLVYLCAQISTWYWYTEQPLFTRCGVGSLAEEEVVLKLLAACHLTASDQTVKNHIFCYYNWYKWHEIKAAIYVNVCFKAEPILGLITSLLSPGNEDLYYILVGVFFVFFLFHVSLQEWVNDSLSHLKLAPDCAPPRPLREELTAVRSWESPRSEKVG